MVVVVPFLDFVSHNFVMKGKKMCKLEQLKYAARMDQVFRNGKVIMAIRSTATKQQARRRGIPTLREKPYLNKINPLSIE